MFGNLENGLIDLVQAIPVHTGIFWLVYVAFFAAIVFAFCRFALGRPAVVPTLAYGIVGLLLVPAFSFAAMAYKLSFAWVTNSYTFGFLVYPLMALALVLTCSLTPKPHLCK
jgi:hypothetical protein